jgi:hypothetical protein
LIARNVVLYVGGVVVLVAVIGAIYLEILVQSRSAHDVWMVTQAVAAGDRLTGDNVRQVSVPDTGDRISYYTGNPVADRKRAGHSLVIGHMLADDDLLQTEMVLVPVTFKSAPPLNHGDVIDVYTQFGARTIQVGRSLPVQSSTTIWVPAIDEPNWITLQANGAQLFAATSSGIGVPASSGLGIQDAVGALSSSISGSSSLTPSVPVPAAPSPGSSSNPTATPRPSPSR